MQIFLMLVLATSVCFGQSDPPFYSIEDLAEEEKVAHNRDEAYNEILNRLLLEQIAILLYNDPDEAKFLQLNPAGLNEPYDYEMDFYSYTGLTENSTSTQNATEEQGGQQQLLEKSPLQDLPAVVQKYMHLLETEDCVDSPFEWTDDTGKDCLWYEHQHQCDQGFVKQVANNGVDAKGACCTCGGGRKTAGCTNYEDWADIQDFSCADYEEMPNRCDLADILATTGSPSASEACCVCRQPAATPPPETSPPSCTNRQGFKDSVGIECYIYEAIQDFCFSDTAQNPNADGVTAIQACCVCHDLPPPVQFCSIPPIPDSNVHIACEAVPYGDECSFECDEDYELIGEYTITCEDGAWRNLPECREKTCTSPHIEHSDAFTSCGGVTYGHWCIFECEPFYHLVPSANGIIFPRCDEGSWTEFATCEAQVLCSSPAIIEADPDDLTRCDNSQVGDYCIFDCNEGFTLQEGENFPACGPDGVWIELPACVPNRVCPIPPIDHSDVASTCTSVPEGHYCIFSCEGGFMKDEKVDVLCEAGDTTILKWSGFPSCVPEVFCPKPNIPNAASTCDGTLVGTPCDVDCMDGFQISGDDPVCLGNGMWGVLPTCDEIAACETLVIENSNSDVVCPTATHGQICEFACDDGFGLSRTDGATCLNSQWQIPLPFCDEHSICNFPQIEHSGASDTCHRTPHGDVCQFDCDTGYEQTGVDLTCNDGKWEPNNGTECVLSQHCTPPVYEHSNSHEICAEVESGGYCVFSCDDNYEREVSYPLCSEDSNGALQWGVNPNIECAEIPHCSSADLIDFNTNASPEYINEHCDGLDVGKVCVPVCMEGFERSGTRAFCGSGGVWDSNIECKEIFKCDQPQIPHSDSLDCIGKLVNEYCAFSCDEGYTRVGLYPRCMVSQGTAKPDWVNSVSGQTNEQPGCNEISKCQTPEIVNANATSVLKCHNSNVADVCVFDCQEGYKISGTFPTCASTGQWGQLPQCVKIDTCHPLVIGHSNADCNRKKAFEVCEFQCNAGWEINGSFPACLDGNSSSGGLYWSGTVECVEDLTCQLAPIIPFSNASECYNTPTDLNCDYACDPGFTNLGSVRCVNGEWDYGDLSGYFSDESLGKMRGGQCLVITRPSKFNTLDQQLFRGDDKTLGFFSGYKTAIEKLIEEDFDEAEYERISNESVDLRNELEALEAECKLDFEQGIFSGYISWEDMCDTLYFRDVLKRRLDQIHVDIGELLDGGDIKQLKARLNEYENDHKHMALVSGGLGKYIKKPNWFTTPSSKEMYDSLKGSRTNNTVHYEVTLTGNSLEEYTQRLQSEGGSNITTGLGRVNHIAAYSNISEFQSITYTNYSTNIIIDMVFRSWGRVLVTPDRWYDDTWTFKAKDAERANRINEYYTYSCEEPACGGDTPLIGPKGLVYTRIKEMFVAMDVTISITGDERVNQQIDTIMHEASSIRVGPFCSGAACQTTGNVIIGGDDLTDHGSNINGINQLGWLYIERALLSIAENTFRGSSQIGKIAVLGSSESTSSSGAGAAIQSAAAAAQLDIWWYDGAAKIQEFFDELPSGVRDPQIIWIPGTGSSNDLEPDESATLATNAMEIHNFAASGGGLLAHGEESSAGKGFDWIKELLPEVQIVYSCDYSTAKLTPAGYEKFKQLHDENIRSGPCHAHFTGNKGNLEALALDSQDRVFVIGGYGGIIKIESEETTVLRDTPEIKKKGGNYYEYKPDVPQIILKAATVI